MLRNTRHLLELEYMSFMLGGPWALHCSAGQGLLSLASPLPPLLLLILLLKNEGGGVLPHQFESQPLCKHAGTCVLMSLRESPKPG